jgi:hypothetical protein
VIDPIYQDLREQLDGALDTVTKLRAQGSLLGQKLLFWEDQGEGLTQDQLIWFRAEIMKLFPRRARKATEGPLDPGL